MEIVIALVAVVIGFIIGRVLPRERPLGDLRVDRSDPTCEPYLFLELGTDVRNIMNKKHVTFRVKVIFRVMSMIGMVLGAVGTLLSNWADDRELDIAIDEKIDEKLAAREDEESEEA